VGQTRNLELITDAPGDWAFHCHMTHGQTGMDMGKMAEIMPYPPNTIAMKGATGPFGDYVSTGGLFTVVKVRDDVNSYDEDPGWYQHPAGLLRSRQATQI
jgi:hypothetical protein